MNDITNMSLDEYIDKDMNTCENRTWFTDRHADAWQWFCLPTQHHYERESNAPSILEDT